MIKLVANMDVSKRFKIFGLKKERDGTKRRTTVAEVPIIYVIRVFIS